MCLCAPVCIVQITFLLLGRAAFPISPNWGERQVKKKQLVNCINSFLASSILAVL